MGNNTGRVECEDYVKNKEEILKEIKEIAASNNAADAQIKIEKCLHQWKAAHVNVCIVGESGVGKSSFINNIDESFGAKVGSKETTAKGTAYPHPKNGNLVFWDLPGYGGKIYGNMKDYFQAMDMGRFDVILFLHAHRFRKQDAELSIETRRVGRPFLIVRTYFDIDTQDCKNEDEEEMKKKEILSELASYGLPSDEYPCYFVSNRSREYEYNLLFQKLFDSVANSEKKDALAFSIKNTDGIILELKKQQLANRIWVTAWAAAANGAIEIPGLGILLNIYILLGEAIFMADVLGIATFVKDTSNLEVFNTCAGYVTSAGIINALQVSAAVMVGAEVVRRNDAVKSVPILGSAVSSTASYVAVRHALESILDKFVEAAEIKMRMDRKDVEK